MTEFDEQNRADNELLDVLRTLEPGDFEFEAPPADLWASIHAQLSTIEAPVPSPPPSTPLAPIAATRRTMRWTGAIAAVAAVAAVAALAVVWTTRDSAETVVATAQLSSRGLAGAPVDLVGGAEIVVVDAERVLHLDLGSARPASGEFLELWLIKPDLSGMVSLGTVRRDGDYPLPVGLEVGEYPIVDVSTEPYDGDPAHSGASLLRGTLTEDDGTA